MTAVAMAVQVIIGLAAISILATCRGRNNTAGLTALADATREPQNVPRPGPGAAPVPGHAGGPVTRPGPGHPYRRHLPALTDAELDALTAIGRAAAGSPTARLAGRGLADALRGELPGYPDVAIGRVLLRVAGYASEVDKVLCPDHGMAWTVLAGAVMCACLDLTEVERITPGQAAP